MRRSRAIGYLVTENADGSLSHTPDPSVSAEERRARMQRYDLERQLEREAWARYPE